MGPSCAGVLVPDPAVSGPAPSFAPAASAALGDMPSPAEADKEAAPGDDIAPGDAAVSAPFEVRLK